MSDKAIGWSFVGIQVVLLGALILLPGSDAWPTPEWLRTVGAVINILGFVLLIVAALVVTSGSWVHLAIGVFTVAFFSVKARWEEQRLRIEYPEYDYYARITGRFVPMPFRHRTP